MGGHDRTNGHGWLRAWIGLGLCLLATAAMSRTSLADIEYASVSEIAPASTAEPIHLAAERIWNWDRGDVRWVVLESKVAALKGVDGVRSDLAVAKISPVLPNGHKVEVYAEKQVRFTSRPGTRRVGRATLVTGSEARFRPYGSGVVVRVDGPPAQFLDLVRRGFPEPDSEGVAPSPAPQIAGSAAPPPSDQQLQAVAPGSSSQGREDHASTNERPTLVDPHSEAVAAEATRPDPARDEQLEQTQFGGEGFEDFSGVRPEFSTPVQDVPIFPGQGGMPDIDSADPGPTDLAPLSEENVPAMGEPIREIDDELGEAPILPGTQRIISIYPRDSTPIVGPTKLPPVREDLDIYLIRGGVRLTTKDPKLGIVDISADNVVIWRGNDKQLPESMIGPDNSLVQDPRQSLEFYLEGNVVFRQDERTELGAADQRVYSAPRAYYDVRSDRFRALDAEADIFVAGLITPFKVKSPLITQYRPEVRLPNGAIGFGLPEVRAEEAVLTGSRFPVPGYRFRSRSVDLTRVPSLRQNPITGERVGPRGGPPDLTWQIDARSNVFYLGPVPVFYWPRFVTNADDLDPPLRSIGFRANNYFGQQVLTDWSAFKLFGLRKPAYIDNWNIDIDYLSARGVALGSEIGWFGRELIPDYAGSYFGFFDIWGLKDNGTDVLGAGPAVITGSSVYDGRVFQRDSVPPLEEFRGRVLLRHMQSLLDDNADPWEDFRLQVEAAYISDRNFLEQYYKRLFETGLDQANLAYLIRQRDNSAFTALVEGNPYGWQTESQWLPRLDYYRLGDSLFDLFTYHHHTGVNYANTHTANEVNNPTIFGGRAFLPYDPTSNTSGVFSSGRFYTAHELDLPLDFDLVRVTPYVQGQLAGWTNQIDQDPLGRAWGAAGGRLEMMAWKAFPTVESEMLNVHGLNHKINFQADYRTAYSSEDLDEIGIQDDLDDNTYEYVRRYFGLSQYAGALIPAQFDPRFLTLRRTLSPITFTTDVQGTIDTLRLGLHQRLQTKRGPEGRRRIIDYMNLDLTTTFFPNPTRDNFGKSFGQNMYNWEWYVGDRTSILSNGWFEFFDISGQPLYKTNPDQRSNYLGLNVITSGIAISRPPRGSVFVGYTVLNSGPIVTSALISTFSYWMSPKWYATLANTYDFGNAILLGSMFSITRIGADYLTTVGLSVDPQRQSYMFGFELVPRLSPNLRLGSAAGMARFDSRFAPTQ